MNFFARILIVVCTFMACFSAWDAQRRDKQASRHPSAADLYEVIQAQILSLRQQRYQEAYLQVSRTYQNVHGIEAFLEAARLDGLAIRQATRWEFGVPEEKESGWEVPVALFSQRGDFLRSMFLVVRENGAWKIDGMRVDSHFQPSRSVSGVRL